MDTALSVYFVGCIIHTLFSRFFYSNTSATPPPRHAIMYLLSFHVIKHKLSHPIPPPTTIVQMLLMVNLVPSALHCSATTPSSHCIALSTWSSRNQNGYIIKRILAVLPLVKIDYYVYRQCKVNANLIGRSCNLTRISTV